MAGTIEINKLRNIESLRFDIPDRGVWLLTASNGAGKTSLLACLRRLGHSNAFPLHFPSSLKSERLDNHSLGTVTYEINGESVQYAYRGQRWTPRPRSNSNLFDKFGYSSVTYIGATADRITPRPEDFDTQNVRSANRHIVDAANDIFETRKFSLLRTINITRGAGNSVFVLAVGAQPYKYHSEKHFSLGELCVLKLLRLIGEVNNNSMIIIDELEMALHPRAQIRLLKYLEKQSVAKNLTVIFSTHSVTLLKTCDRKKIIYLENNGSGVITPIVGCYPTYALGSIADVEEALPDIMLYSEDLFARDILNAFFDLFSNSRFGDPTLRPTLKVVPVGGFQEVISFLERNRSVLPNQVIQKAILDADVSDETLLQWNNANNHSQLAKYQRLRHDIKFLPFTPEVGLISYIASNLADFEQALRQRCVDNQIQIANIIHDYDVTLSGATLRNCAKKIYNNLASYLEERTQRSQDQVREIVCGIFASSSWNIHRQHFSQLFGSML